jgi:cobalt-zinc-cadmium resistance protein CzcA
MAVGHQVGTVLEGERRFDMMVKFATSLRPATSASPVDDPAALEVSGTGGPARRRGDDLHETTGPVLVNREKQSRRVIVEFNVRGRDLVSTVQDAQAALAAGPGLPVGYRVEYGGTFEHYIAARDR